MAKHEIVIDVDLDGIIESEVFGIIGSGCEIESKWLEVLGTKKVHKKTKDAGKTRKQLINVRGGS